MKTKWGIIGTGRIARKFADGLRQSRTGELVAVGSRSQDSANQFTKKFPATAYGSYEALLADPAIEVVYVCTPHPMHAEWVIKAAEAGKHVLCEKPLAVGYSDALAMIEAARRNDVFLMEAFMYRCHPQTARVVQLIRDQVIGEVKFIRANFSFSIPFNPESRLLDPKLGGGGILDVGCYCVSMARLIAGAACGKPFENPIETVGVGHLGPTGVDEYAIASLKFPGGVLAQVAAGVQLSLENNVRIVGSEGSILVPAPWIVNGLAPGFSKILVFKDNIPEEIVIEADRSIYAMEADHVAEHIPDRQAPAMSWDDSLGNMKTLDAWRYALDEIPY
ncbi:MAG: Gfo/Idh/MocA family oxidoreductase [Verrucomicrobiota bacterium]